MERLVKIRPELIKEADEFKWTPLHFAAFYGYLEVVGLLLQCDSSAAYLSDKDEMSPLHGFSGIPNTSLWVDTNSRIGMKGEAVKNEESISPTIKKDGRHDESLARTFEAHLVVAALISTVTFAAAFTMPGGYESEGPDQGMPIFIDIVAFKLFVIFDIIACAFSTAAVYLLFYASYFGYHQRPNYFHRVLAYIYVALVGMTLAAVAGMHAMLVKSAAGLSMFADIMAVYFVLVFLVEWFFGPDLGGPDVLGLPRARRYFKNLLFKYGG